MAEDKKHQKKRKIVMFSGDYFDENPQKYCKVVIYARKKQQQNKLEELDRTFGFPKNSEDLSREKLSAFDVLKRDYQLRKIIQELFGGESDLTDFKQISAFSEWLAVNGGFSGLIDGNKSWRKSEGLCYIAFLRQYGLHNYREVDDLYRVTSDVVAEAITVLYNCRHPYSNEDARVLRISRLVKQRGFENFKPIIFVLKSEGWWDDKVSLDKYKSLMRGCNRRLHDYFNKVGKDWSEKKVKSKFVTKEKLRFHLNKLRKNRKTKFENSLSSQRDQIQLDDFFYLEKSEVSKEKETKKLNANQSSSCLSSKALKTKLTTNSTPLSCYCSKINTAEKNSKSPPKIRKLNIVSIEEFCKKQKPHESSPAEKKEDKIKAKSVQSQNSNAGNSELEKQPRVQQSGTKGSSSEKLDDSSTGIVLIDLATEEDKDGNSNQNLDASSCDVKVKEEKFEVIQQVSYFLKFGKVENLNLTTVGDLLSASEKLQIRDLKIACKDYLVNNLNIENAWLISKLCEKHSLEDVKVLVTGFVEMICHHKSVFS